MIASGTLDPRKCVLLLILLHTKTAAGSIRSHDRNSNRRSHSFTFFYTWIRSATSHPIASLHPSFPMIIQSLFCWITSTGFPSQKSWRWRKSITCWFPSIHLIVYRSPDFAVDKACMITPPDSTLYNKFPFMFAIYCLTSFSALFFLYLLLQDTLQTIG